MSYRNGTVPCDSNDYQVSLYDLNDDDEFTVDIVPCPNTTSTTAVSDETGATSSTNTVDGGTESGSTNGGGNGNTEDDLSVESSQTNGGTGNQGNSNSNSNNGNNNGGDSNKGTSNTSQTDKIADETAKETSSQTQEVHVVETKTSTFYTCHPDPTSLLKGVLAPDDSGAIKLEIVWDYEVVVSTDGANGDTKIIQEGVSELERTMTEDLATQYGLLDCTSQRSRGLRKNRKNGQSASSAVVALDSDPADQVLKGQSCSTAAESNTICSPVRGYMTVWSDNASTDILPLIKIGMKKDSYTSDKVVKVVYIGIPSESGINEANSSTNQSQEMSDNSATGTSGGIFLPIVLSMFVLAFVSITLFIVHRRRKANDERNGPKQPRRQQVLQTQTIDLEDDINLLPSPEKLDMRPIYETDSDTASGEHKSFRELMKADESSAHRSVRSSDDEDLNSLQESVLSVDESVESGSAASGKSSALAAMGAASTLTMRMAGSDT
eukprot:CCRYP_010304-RA/>CCRYP_010304-RA protein AED:0.03 eAED:0.03 QI:366/1/1/1/0.5/0.33/3/938/493